MRIFNTQARPDQERERASEHEEATSMQIFSPKIDNSALVFVVVLVVVDVRHLKRVGEESLRDRNMYRDCGKITIHTFAHFV